MTILSASGESYRFTAKATIIEDDRDMASTWASAHIKHNDAIKWIVGNYVEADNANSNGQYWSLEDLRLSQPTIAHAPMNIGHSSQHVVGTYVASEMIYPAEAASHPYIETVGAMWKYYFPEELEAVQAAFSEGSLFQSMECIASSVTCVGPNGCGETFDYGGPHGAYCDHINERSSFRQLNNPHFLAGALIIPPTRPGWSGAEVNDVSELLKTVDVADVYEQVVADNPMMDPTQWESLMQLIALNDVARRDNTEDAKRAGRLLGEQVAKTLYSY